MVLKLSIQNLITKRQNELLQDFETIIKDEKITDQEIYKNEEMPEPNIENTGPVFVPFASTASNKSLVSVLNMSYKKNYSTNKGTATYAKSGTKTANLVLKHLILMQERLIL